MPTQQIYDEYDGRKFMIFNVSELDQVNFSEVLETGPETVRKSVDRTKTLVKWEGSMPDCVYNLTTKEGPYTYDEILAILATPEWTDPNPYPMG
jgi:hypothetical protein